MDIDFPSQAEEYFNQQADSLLSRIRPATLIEGSHEGTQSSFSHVYSETFEETDILEIAITGMLDRSGREKARYFQTEDDLIGLEDEHFLKFEELTYKLSIRPEIRSFLSLDFVKSTLFEWLEKLYKTEFPPSVEFIPYLKEKGAQEIKTRKIAIPVVYLTIENPFTIGNVTFEFFTREFFNELEGQIRAKVTDQTEELNQAIQAMRKRYQGIVYAAISVKAELRRCIQIAKEETEKALMVLRLFSPTTFVPEIPSYVGMMGKISLPSTYLFYFEDGRSLNQEELDERRDPRWIITDQDMQLFGRLGLNHASELTRKEEPTKLESTLLTALMIFTKGVSAHDHQEKLVFTLASIETLLLEDSTEPIQRSMGQRLAFLCESTAQKRREVVDLVKDAYRYRSRYLHHGESKSEIKLLQKLQHAVWTGFMNVLRARDRFSSKQDLLNAVETEILS